ncbi:MAG: L-ribulose-5-phosphate 3-epimerase [Anaerolineae bacterium]|jgi:L-ribulose-5-phosphate 3-epimerase|nr:L-ribulose-5-phosphate 3-epimerase [Anaerolineae bacterium]
MTRAPDGQRTILHAAGEPLAGPVEDAGLALAGLPVGLYEKGLPAPWSWDRRLAAAAEAGYDFVEISIDESDERLARIEGPASNRDELRRAIAESGLPILTMCLSGHRRYPLGSRSPQVRQRAADIVRRAIAFAVDVGVRIVQIAGYDVFYEESDAATAARYVEGLQRAAEWAGQAGVMLALENVDVPLTESIHRCMEIVRQVNSLWFQIYPDMANVAAAGYDPVAELATCAGHMVGIHVKDALPRTIRRVPFGTGIVPFEPVFQALAGQGYRGPMVVEMWSDEGAAGDPMATARAARQFVADLVNKTHC